MNRIVRLGLTLVLVVNTTALFAGDPSIVLAPDDQRLGRLKELTDYFPFDPPETKEEWVQRAEKLRRRLLVAQGLWPLPTRSPLNAVVHGKLVKDDYTIEKVYFEGMPGFFVTGNLYRPLDRAGRLPGVL
ncbi:MAG: acetylxylan esterase, partial [Pirellulales bacterium]